MGALFEAASRAQVYLAVEVMRGPKVDRDQYCDLQEHFHLR
jgi:hypothetical protein